MKSKSLVTFITTAVIAAAALVSAQSDTARQIQELEAKIADLKRQLAQITAIQGSPNTVETPGMRVAGVGFSAELRRGSRGNAVKRLQEFLAGLPGIYPKGLVTGTFGPLTEAAVKRFQEKLGIPAVGIVGPLTRAKLNDILLGKITPEGVIVPPAEPVAPMPTPTPPPPAPPPAPATTTPPAAPQAAATSTPATATTTPAAPPALSGPIPTPGQLGLPLLSFFGWGKDYLRVGFDHDPDVYTLAYAIYIKRPGQTASTKLGPYKISEAVAGTVPSDGATFSKIGKNAWEWRKNFDFDAEPAGTYDVFVTAVGNGDVESSSSPGRIATLYGASAFDDLLQSINSDVVKNATVTELPLGVRLKDPIENLYYRYEIYDGGTKIWDGGNIRKADKAGVQVSFTNPNNYPLGKGKTYKIRVDSYDNDVAGDSVTKQKPNETTFVYSPVK